MRSFVRLVARVRFFDPLALLLGPFRDDLGLVLGLLGPLFGSAGPFLAFSWGGLLAFLYRLRASPKMFHPLFV